ncbi:hypothetical protein [Gemmiger formicilis]|uniref:hypothetical protein n=1 Tax=Gemmiger formicilis TaxID=745368 RepID=UPI00117AEC8C|nr:hypothetical protein [Gemmiger formicilis]
MFSVSVFSEYFAAVFYAWGGFWFFSVLGVLLDEPWALPGVLLGLSVAGAFILTIVWSGGLTGAAYFCVIVRAFWLQLLLGGVLVVFCPGLCVVGFARGACGLGWGAVCLFVILGGFVVSL